MKKIILSLVFAVSAIAFANAQENAIGLKFGYGADISYQRNLGSSNRLEFNLNLDGFDGNSFGLQGLYQWVWDLDQLAQGFKWYAGVGAGLGTWRAADKDNRAFALAVLGNIGIEYNFNIPLQLALDWTPGVRIIPSGDGRFGYEGIKLAIRYKF
ncbi:MAG: hypothetical protein LBU90_02905 [Bacteroidales bacterium]|jgi:hypothetical protein|nr:hypothetical protein [Bacteroidales bacterium]